MLVRVFLLLALPAMLIPPGICLCHIGEPERAPASSDDESLPPDDEDHDEDCPAHGQGKLALLKRCADARITLLVAQQWQPLPSVNALASHFDRDESSTFVAESPPLYLSLLTLRI